jgi:hypothetical protein
MSRPLESLVSAYQTLTARSSPGASHSLSPSLGCSARRIGYCGVLFGFPVPCPSGFPADCRMKNFLGNPPRMSYHNT